MRTLVLLTVPRTGTHFFRNLLMQHVPLSDFTSARQGRPGLTVAHVSNSGLNKLDRVPDPVVITTWRDWDKVKASFTKHNDTLASFEVYYEAWQRLLSEFNPMIVTVDPHFRGVSRDGRLDLLGWKLRLKLETDWAVVNA